MARGELNFWLVVILGAFGNLVGSWLAYFIGHRGGRPLIQKYGKYILISHHDLNMADKWFAKFGDFMVFIGRLLPVVRTYISFPAGIAKMNFKKFSIYTFAGALPWSLLFAWLGVKMGDNWELIRQKLHDFDMAMLVLVIVAVVWYVVRHVRRRNQQIVISKQ